MRLTKVNEIKLVKISEGNWGIELTNEMMISGFPDEGHAGVWLLEYIARMALVHKMDETRKQFAGALLLSDKPQKKQ